MWPTISVKTNESGWVDGFVRVLSVFKSLNKIFGVLRRSWQGSIIYWQQILIIICIENKTVLDSWRWCSSWLQWSRWLWGLSLKWLLALKTAFVFLAERFKRSRLFPNCVSSLRSLYVGPRTVTAVECSEFDFDGKSNRLSDKCCFSC